MNKNTLNALLLSCEPQILSKPEKCLQRNTSISVNCFPDEQGYCFDGLQLKPYYTEFYNVIINRLIDRGLITPEEAEGVRPEDLKIT